MGHVPTLLDVKTFMKIFATIAVALLAFVAMANPAWAQDVNSELSVDTKADPDPAMAGKALTYTVVVTNTGNVEAEDMTFLDSMDFGDTNVDPGSVSASTTQPGGSCTVGDPTTVVCLLANLAPGAKATVTIKLTPTSVGTISNTATAGALYAPRVTDTTTTTVGPPIVELSVDTRADSDLPRAGKALTYTVVVTNTGALEAEDVTLLDVLDFGTVEVDPASFSVDPGLSPTPEGSCLRLGGTATSATVSCTLPNLAPGASATVTIKLTPTTQGTISNSAVAAASNAQSAENSITTAVVPDLVIGKWGPSWASMSGYFFQDVFMYEIRVTNQGPTTANNVIVTDALPTGPQGQSVINAGFADATTLPCQGGDYIQCEGSIPAGETAFIGFLALAEGDSAWVINNTAEVRVQGISSVIGSSTATTQAVPLGSGLPGEEPGEDNGKRVLVDHKGKELCLPKAALKGHLRHGDEVISEEGCSNAEDGGRRGLK
jgi:uncharacterized repeat protein (TIGR01451 family)